MQGLTAVLYPYVQKIPELRAVSPQPFNVDAAAASHHELFQFNVFAQESFFLSDDGLVGGEKTAVVQQHYSQRGYLLTAIDGDADHLGQELAFLAFLTAAEADAWESAQPEQAKQCQAQQKAFMQDHLLHWLMPCLLAIQEQSDSLFAELARLTEGLVLGHFEELGKTAVSSPLTIPTFTQKPLS